MQVGTTLQHPFLLPKQTAATKQQTASTDMVADKQGTNSCKYLLLLWCKCHLLFTKRVQKAKTNIQINLFISWWRGRRASQSQTSLAHLENQMEFSPCRRRFPLCWRCTASSCGSARRATSCFFTAVCLGILCSGSSRQTALQSSVPPAAIQFTSTLSFLYMTAEKQILPACRCALRIIKFGSIQHLICQTESPPLFFGGDTNL